MHRAMGYTTHANILTQVRIHCELNITLPGNIVHQNMFIMFNLPYVATRECGYPAQTKCLHLHK